MTDWPPVGVDEIAVGKCSNCGYIYGDDLDYRFPEMSECQICGEELEKTAVADEETVRSLAEDGLRPDGGTVDDGTDKFAEDVVAEIRDVLDMDEDETLVIQTPQFERADGVKPGRPPLTADAMDRLTHADESDLKDLGLRKWSDDTGLWLLPYEWHPHLPPEYPLLSILDEWTSRSELPANPDKRFGVLSIGIVPEFEKQTDRPLEPDTGQEAGR